MLIIHKYLIIEFILIFFRVIAMLAVLPFVGSSLVPKQAKIGMAFFISLTIYPLVTKIEVLPRVSFPEILLLISSQVMIGVIFGFLVLIIFTGVELAGMFAGMQIGFGMISLLNPLMSNQEVSLLSNMENFIALMIFIQTSAFFFVIEGLYKSFKTIPLTFINFSPYIFKYLIDKSNDIFIIGLDLSMPIVIVAIILNVIIAFMGRIAPQFNIFAVGFPIIIVAGLLVLYLFIPYFSDFTVNSFVHLKYEFGDMINAMASIK